MKVQVLRTRHAQPISGEQQTAKKEETMDSLKLFRIEAVVADDRLTKEIVAKRLGSFIIQLKLAEVSIDPLGGYTKHIAKAKPADKPKTKPAAKKAAAKKPKARRVTSKTLTAKVAERIEIIKAALGKGEMSIAQVVKATGLSQDMVTHALLIGEQKRMFACRLVSSKKGVRPIRHFKVIR